MKKRKTCFVISPIGEKDSGTRKLADDLYDLIIVPALEKFDFDIVRADKITSVTSITSDIISHVQNADLCIVDLTGQNANVMYECGRRHETGKPFIMVAKENEKIPFDINTIRTFFYNTDNPRNIREFVVTIQQVVKNFVDEGFDAQTSGESLSSISDSLRRIERKLEDIVTVKQIPTHSESSEVDELLKNLTPYEAYKYALSQGNRRLAAEIFAHIFPNLKNYDIATQLYHCIPVASHSELASKIVEENIIKTDMVNDADADVDWIQAFERLTYFWRKNNLAKEKLPQAIAIKDILLPLANSNTDRASIIKDMGFLYYSVDMNEECLQCCEEVVSLSSENPYNWGNLAKICIEKTINKLDRAEEAIDKMVAIGTDDDDHLKLAIQVYKAKNRNDDVYKQLEHLRKINPFKAKLVEIEEIKD